MSYREHATTCLQQLQDVVQSGTLNDEDEEFLSIQTQWLLEKMGILPKEQLWTPIFLSDLS